MTEGLVSIVLPIYKVQKYLNRCIESVVRQTYANLEIILVDDGSPDDCPQICDEWALKDSRIKVVHKENQGLGMARNTGIENATGEYICFFDSDDYVAEDAIEKLYKAVKKNNADVVHFGFHRVTCDGDVIKTVISEGKKNYFKGDEVKDEFLPDLIAPDTAVPGCRRYYMSACLFMYSTELLHNSDFAFVSEREIISEDVFSLLKLFGSVKSVEVVCEALYFYRENPSSLSQSYLDDRYKGIRHFYVEAVKLCEDMGYGKEAINRLRKPYLGFVLAALKQETFSGRKYINVKNSFKCILNDEILQNVLEEIAKEKISKTKRIMYWSMRRKFYGLCYVFCRLKANM